MFFFLRRRVYDLNCSILLFLKRRRLLCGRCINGFGRGGIFLLGFCVEVTACRGEVILKESAERRIFFILLILRLFVLLLLLLLFVFSTSPPPFQESSFSTYHYTVFRVQFPFEEAFFCSCIVSLLLLSLLYSVLLSSILLYYVVLCSTLHVSKSIFILGSVFFF